MATRRPEQYATLLRVRKRQEDLNAQVLAGVRREMRAAELQREDFERQQRRAIDSAQAYTGEDFDERLFCRYVGYQRYLARMAVAKDAEIEQLRQQVEGRRLDLENAMCKRRMVDRLIERSERILLKKVKKEEQRLSDEAASTQAALAIVSKAVRYR